MGIGPSPHSHGHSQQDPFGGCCWGARHWDGHLPLLVGPRFPVPVTQLSFQHCLLGLPLTGTSPSPSPAHGAPSNGDQSLSLPSPLWGSL